MVKKISLFTLSSLLILSSQCYATGGYVGIKPKFNPFITGFKHAKELDFKIKYLNNPGGKANVFLANTFFISHINRDASESRWGGYIGLQNTEYKGSDSHAIVTLWIKRSNIYKVVPGKYSNCSIQDTSAEGSVATCGVKSTAPFKIMNNHTYVMRGLYINKDLYQFSILDLNNPRSVIILGNFYLKHSLGFSTFMLGSFLEQFAGKKCNIPYTAYKEYAPSAIGVNGRKLNYTLETYASDFFGCDTVFYLSKSKSYADVYFNLRKPFNGSNGTSLSSTIDAQADIFHPVGFYFDPLELKSGEIVAHNPYYSNNHFNRLMYTADHGLHVDDTLLTVHSVKGYKINLRVWKNDGTQKLLPNELSNGQSSKLVFEFRKQDNPSLPIVDSGNPYSGQFDVIVQRPSNYLYSGLSRFISQYSKYLPLSGFHDNESNKPKHATVLHISYELRFNKSLQPEFRIASVINEERYQKLLNKGAIHPTSYPESHYHSCEIWNLYFDGPGTCPQGFYAVFKKSLMGRSRKPKRYHIKDGYGYYDKDKTIVYYGDYSLKNLIDMNRKAGEIINQNEIYTNLSKVLANLSGRITRK